MELPTSSCHGVLYPRYYGLVGNSSSKPHEGSRGVVLLSPRIWKGCHQNGALDIGISCITAPHLKPEARNTHTLQGKLQNPLCSGWRIDNTVHGAGDGGSTRKNWEVGIGRGTHSDDTKKRRERLFVHLHICKCSAATKTHRQKKKRKRCHPSIPVPNCSSAYLFGLKKSQPNLRFLQVNPGWAG